MALKLPFRLMLLAGVCCYLPTGSASASSLNVENLSPNVSAVVSRRDIDGDGIPNSRDVDDDNDGLIEIFNLTQLDQMRNNLAGTSLIGFDRSESSAGCPAKGCRGYELMRNLNFDTNRDDVMDCADTYVNYHNLGTMDCESFEEAYHNDARYGWLPIGSEQAPFTASFNGNGYAIRNLYIHRSNNEGDETRGSYIGLFGHIVYSGSDQDYELSNIRLNGRLTSVSSLPPLITDTDAGGSSPEEEPNNAGILVGRLSVTNSAQVHIQNNLVRGELVGSHAVGLLIGSLSLSEQAQVDIGQNQSRGSTDHGFLFDNDDPEEESHTTSEHGGLIGEIFISASDGAVLTVSDNNARVNMNAGDFSGGLIGSLGITSSTGLTRALLENNTATGRVESYGSDYVGGLVGWAYASNGQLSIRYNQARGSVSGRFFGTGGLVGFLDNGIIEHSSATGNVSGSGTGGGLVGHLKKGLIQSSSATGNVVGAGFLGFGTGAMGGLVGYMGDFDSDTAAYIETSYSTGNVSGGSSIGGLVGLANGHISRSFALGIVEGESTVGGLVGSMSRTDDTQPAIRYSFSTGSVIADENGGGFVGSLAGAIMSNTASPAIEGSFTTSAGNNLQGVLAGVVSYSDSDTLSGDTLNQHFENNYYMQVLALFSGQAVPAVGDYADSEHDFSQAFTVDDLQCPMAANDSICVENASLFSDWDTYVDEDGQAIWDFGTANELPGLIINGEVYRDGNGDGHLD